MKIENVFIIAAVSICFVFLSIFYGIGAYELTVDWEIISRIIVAVYLYFIYLILSMIFGKPKDLLWHFQRSALYGRKRSADHNEVSEHV